MKGEITLAIQVPRVRVSDAPPVAPQVSGASTSITAFLGHSSWGPVGQSVLCTSWEEYKRVFGGLFKDYMLGYAVRAFFNNGGSLARITRVVHYSDATDKTTKTSKAASVNLNNDDVEPVPVVTLNAKYDGKYGEDIKVTVENSTNVDYDLIVKYKGVIVERYTKLTPDNIIDRLKSSAYLGEPTSVSTTETPKNVIDAPLTGANEGMTSITETDFVGDPGEGTGMYSLDNFAVDLLAIPDKISSSLANSALTYAEGRGDIFVVVDVPKGTVYSEVPELKTNIAVTDYGSIYYPHVRITDPLATGADTTKLIPPSGFVCGCFSRNDTQRGVWKAPAGMEMYLVDAIGLEYDIDDTKQSILNPIGINCLRVFGSVVIWGSELIDVNSQYANVNGKRFQIYIKKSLKNNFRWVVFEPIDEKILGPTGKIEVSSEAWLETLDKDSRGGPFDHEAGVIYNVKADFENNPKASRDSGKVQIDVSYSQKGVAKDINFSVGLSK